MKLKDYWLPAAAAAEVGVAHNTLKSAYERGDVATTKLGCGKVVVCIRAAHKWAKQREQKKSDSKQ